jgi:hypothetical protein
VSLAAILCGVRVAVHQMRCRHTLVRASVTIIGGECVPVMVCRSCGWTDLQPLVW